MVPVFVKQVFIYISIVDGDPYPIIFGYYHWIRYPLHGTIIFFKDSFFDKFLFCFIKLLPKVEWN